jgi:imidazolonepropionase
MPAANGLLIRNAAQIVTCPSTPARGDALGDVQIHSDGWLFVENGVIDAVGDRAAVESRVKGSPQEIDASGKTVVAGFIDPHTHAVFAGSRVDEFVRKIGGATYAEIAAKGGGILSTVKATRAASKAELKELTRARLKTALQHGTTTMEIKSGYGLDLENEVKMLDVIAELGAEQPVELIPTFLGAHAVPPECGRTEYLSKVMKMLEVASGKAKFFDAFCDAAYFPPAEIRDVLLRASDYGLGIHLHAGQFAADGGVRLGIQFARAVAHLDFITDAEIADLAKGNAAAVLLPGVSLFGRTPWPPARKLIDAGAVVALATNFNPGSCPSLSVPMMTGLACMGMGMSPAEALNAVTINAAHALGLRLVGSIKPGWQADLVILEHPDYRMMPYYFGVNPVETVVKKGRLVWQR